MDGADRLRKEAFVSHLTGTSVQEVLAVSLVMPLMALPASVLQEWLERRGVRYWPLGFGANFMALVLPFLGAVMGGFIPIYSSWVAVALCMACSMLRKEEDHERAWAAAKLQKLGTVHRKYIASYRGALMLSTCTTILAVDFPAFPRRFAKVERYGTGLMDVGPGSFVMASGIVSQAGRGMGIGGSLIPSGTRIAEALRGVYPLLLLGIARLVATSLTNYQVHEAEYGAHWNFFFTLASVGFLTAVFPLRGRRLEIGCLAIILVHQLLLSLPVVPNFVLSEERSGSLLSLNREGIISIPGYWSLHLLGALIGRTLLWTSRFAAKRAESPAGQEPGQHDRCLQMWLTGVAATGVVLWAGFALMSARVAPVSRSECNATYIAWMAAYTVSLLFVCILVEVFGPDHVPRLLADASGSMLTVFLAANVLTGLVNLSIDTLDASDLTARGVTGAYMMMVCCVPLLARQSSLVSAARL